MDKRILMLRISFWVGAVIDAFAVGPLVFPEIHAYMYGIPGFNATPVIYNFSYIGAALMLGWTVLLIWADRKPMERKGVLLITVFPVVAGIAYSSIYLAAAGVIKLSSIMPTLIMQVCITGLFLFSYFFAAAGKKAVNQAD
jgi:CHASE2 domain-containing sensor protein